MTKNLLSKETITLKIILALLLHLEKLENLSNYVGGAQIWTKMVSEANGGAHKIYNATVHCLIAKKAGKKYIVGDTGAGYAGKMLSMAAKKFGFKCKDFHGYKRHEETKT